MRKKKKTVAVCGVLLAAALSLGGCSTKGGLKVVLTGGLSRNELFSVNKAAMTLPEAKLLLMTELARYRNLYGEEMLSRQFGGQTLEESVKESTLDLMGKLLVMDEMADKYQIRLNEEDTANILSASAEYMDTLTETEKAFTGASESDVQHLFEKALLADRVYAELTGEQTIEVSDDEARVVTVRHIFISTAGRRVMRGKKHLQMKVRRSQPRAMLTTVLCRCTTSCGRAQTLIPWPSSTVMTPRKNIRWQEVTWSRSWRRRCFLWIPGN